MKQHRVVYLFTIAIMCSYLVACSKYTTNTSTSTGNSNVFLNGDTAPRIMFFDVMDYGSMDVKLNGTKVSSIAKFYNSTYFYGKEGTNTISLNFPGKADAINTTLELVRNTRYSCFFYKVGDLWMYDLVKDDIGTTLGTNRCGIRVLDFRTEAYSINYINVRVAMLAGDYLDQTGRIFLDHRPYGGYTYFTNMASNINTADSATISLYTSTTTYKQRRYNFNSQGYYSVILTTPTGITPYTNALNYMWPDVVKHN